MMFVLKKENHVATTTSTKGVVMQLDQLSEDVVYEILARVSSASFGAVECTCRRFRDCMGTPRLRQKRGELGCLEEGLVIRDGVALTGVSEYGRRRLTNFERIGSGSAWHGSGLYIIGGFDGFEASKSVTKYDAVMDRWTELPPMQFARVDCAATFWRGRLVVAGGYDAEEMCTSVEFFDGEWRSLPSLPWRSLLLDLHELQNDLYLVDRLRGAIFVLRQDSWIRCPSLFDFPVKAPGIPLATAVLHGCLYVLSLGDDDHRRRRAHKKFHHHPPLDLLVASRRIAKYDPRDQTWSLVAAERPFDLRGRDPHGDDIRLIAMTDRLALVTANLVAFFDGRDWSNPTTLSLTDSRAIASLRFL